MDVIQNVNAEQKNEERRYRAIYSHPRWKSEASEYEQELARRLYNRKEVREAGQRALSKISTLLVRYNRLKEFEEKNQSSSMAGETTARQIYEKKKKEIEEERKKLEGMSDDDAKKRLEEKLAQQEEEAGNKYNKAIKELESQNSANIDAAMSMHADDDSSGGILSTLLLGGDAPGGQQYFARR